MMKILDQFRVKWSDIRIFRKLYMIVGAVMLLTIIELLGLLFTSKAEILSMLVTLAMFTVGGAGLALTVALNTLAVNLKESSSARQLAQDTDRIKNLFLANMSHEMRTPLNAILGFVNLLKDPTLTATERAKYIEIISRTGHTLATIINDILDISKVEAGKLEIEKTPCLLTQILRDTYALLNLRCEEKGILLTFNCKNLPSYIHTDPTRLKQILLNVIGNAIKFTKAGGVTVTLDAREKLLICTVEDTGVGIAKCNIEKLFQVFSQVDPSVRKEFGGTGLGLILSKRIANLMGGDVILVSSELGVGSRFQISIGLELASAQYVPADKVAVPLVHTQPLRGKKILVVEDSIDNQLLVQQLLIREGAQVEFANHGEEAVTAVALGPYDIILMDMQMPVMDGYTATSHLRQHGYGRPIIALTAHAMREDLDKCVHAGCDDYLCKPYQRDDLIRIINQYCKQERYVS